MKHPNRGVLGTAKRSAAWIGRLHGSISIALILAALNTGCVGVTTRASTTTGTAALQIATPALPDAITQTAYTGAFSATGGTPPYSWSITSGSLPLGLNLNSSSGQITGTPTTAGTFTFTAEVRDSSATPQMASAPASVLTIQLLQITTTSLPDPELQTSYSVTLTASGGAAPYVWSISSGSLPPGLTLDSSTGVISGVPTSTGSYAFTVEVSDPPSAPQRSKKTLTSSVQPKLKITTSGLPNTQVQATYSSALAASGGTTPYSWSISSGTLPAGLTLNSSTGALSGTPTQSGTFSFTAQVADSASHTAQQSLSIQVAAIGQLSISTTSLPQGTVNVAYLTSLQATGGTAPYSWSISAGALPAGLSLSAATGAISGTPTQSGTVSFATKVTDAAGQTGQQSLSIAVLAAPLITSQPANQTVTAGQAATFAVTVTGSTPLNFQWSKNGTVISGATGSTYTTPATASSDSGAQFWVTVSNSAGTVTSKTAVLTVSAAAIAPSITIQPNNQGIAAGQSATFSVTAAGTAPLTYQWQKNGVPISGAISSSYTTPPETISDNGAQMNVVVSNSMGSITSNTAILTVNAPGQLSTSTSNLAFGNVNIGSSSTQSATLTNSGGSSVTISNVTMSGAGFSVSGISSGLILTPGGFATIDVTFTPAVSSSVTGSVTITSNAANPSLTISLSGAGLSNGNSKIGCGTDLNGSPTDNSTCGANGANTPSPYTGEGYPAVTNLTQWCGGNLPGSCTIISSCSAATLKSGTPAGHAKYYLATALNCGAGSIAITPGSYTDVNLNDQTISGNIYWNNGALRGFHIFNGTINCTVAYPNGCVDFENIDGNFSQGGGDDNLVHHLAPQNSDTSGYNIRVTGQLTPSGGSWNAGEYAIQAFNNTFIVPSGNNGRTHGGFYTETHPAVAYNNKSQCQAAAPTCQQLEFYAKYQWLSTQTGHSYAHNNWGFCANLTDTTQYGCRGVLFDGCQYCHAQYNDFWPNSIDGATCQTPNTSENRGIRLRDALSAEVDHNYIHCFGDAAIHSGDSDVNTGFGQSLNQNLHDNTFESAGGSGLYALQQQGITLNNNTYLCAAGGCTGGKILTLFNQLENFSGSVTIGASAKTLTCAGCSFNISPAILPGSVVTLSGFANAGNNNTFSVVSATATVVTFADPSNLLVNETTTSGHWGGVTAVTLTGVAAANIGTGFSPMVSLTQAEPTVSLTYCGSISLPQNVSGGATVINSCAGL